MRPSLFRDRRHAGRVLAASLPDLSGRPDVLVLALPRGGVPVGYEVARALRAPLDVYLVRKLGVPGHEELAMGAIASAAPGPALSPVAPGGPAGPRAGQALHELQDAGGRGAGGTSGAGSGGSVRVLNAEVVNALQISDEVIESVAAREQAELERRERLYRGGRALPDVCHRTVVLVDDGLATGSTMRAAAAALCRQGPARVVVAVPVASPETCRELQADVDQVVCVATPEPFYGVGLWYDDFSQTTDDEVRSLLAQASAEPRAA